MNEKVKLWEEFEKSAHHDTIYLIKFSFKLRAMLNKSVIEDGWVNIDPGRIDGMPDPVDIILDTFGLPIDNSAQVVLEDPTRFCRDWYGDPLYDLDETDEFEDVKTQNALGEVLFRMKSENLEIRK